jgi:hypothetical protein
MNESTARRLVLVRSFDTASSPIWTPEDAAWATRLATETAPADASPERFLSERAHHALQRIEPRERAVARWLGASVWRWSWLPAAAVIGALFGLAANVLGRTELVDLLSPPAWAVMAWNLVVYVVLIVTALRGGGGKGGVIRRTLLAWWRRGVGKGPLREATAQWALLSAPMTASRVAVVLHVAAAALGAGLVAGMYMRGLVFDYRAGWQSTFFDAEQVQRILSVLFAPASALTGIAVPDMAAMEALRVTPAAPQATASAAPWIHLYATTLGLLVIVPRLVLALMAMLRAAWQSRSVPLPLDDAYFQGLLRKRRTGPALVRVHPYAAPAGAQAALGLRALLAVEFGEDLQLQMGPLVRMGDEDAAAQLIQGDPPALQIALVDLGATPEADSHGRFITALRKAAPGSPFLLVADEAAFASRFAGMPGRLDERRAGWRAFAEAQGVRLLSADLGASDPAVGVAALRAALHPA